MYDDKEDANGFTYVDLRSSVVSDRIVDDVSGTLSAEIEDALVKFRYASVGILVL
jgi:hypothetical protein